jgi:cytochrome c-type biogenesis protein CcmH/NrfG
MPEQDFTNREIKLMFHELKDQATRIERQTTLTNGRVSDLEKWRYISMGSVAVLVMLVIPLLSWALFTLSNIDHKIQNAVNESLQ